MGGQLCQDIPAFWPNTLPHWHDPAHETAHAVHLQPGTPFAALWDAEDIRVNSHHHQGVAGASEGFVVAGRAPDGVPEAGYVPGRRFALAVQWHPERNRETAVSARLFSAFVAACH